MQRFGTLAQGDSSQQLTVDCFHQGWWTLTDQDPTQPLSGVSESRQLGSNEQGLKWKGESVLKLKRAEDACNGLAIHNGDTMSPMSFQE